MIEVKSHCLIMAGGKGTRFWPESTASHPKQYLKLLGEKSLLEETIDRFDGLVEKSRRYIVTIKDQEKLAQVCSNGKVPKENLIFEPESKNTAPCLLLSLATLLSRGAKQEDVVMVVPSDHVILNKEGFKSVLKEAGHLAASTGNLVTIGIPPHFPHTGFGYIQKGELLGESAYQVKKFVEKPDNKTAQKYLASGEYLWNAGMFVGTIGTFVVEFEKYSPKMAGFFEGLQKYAADFKNLSKVYGEMPADSIDYAVMEKSSKVAVMPARFDWNDLGSWDALESVLSKTQSNTVIGNKGLLVLDAEGNIVHAPGKWVSLVGVKDLVVVATDKAILVMPKKDSQRVKEVVDRLKSDPQGKHLI